MITTNTASVKSLTTSNSEIGGQMTHSSTCDGRHYWAFIFHGTQTRLNMSNNYVHHTSGRLPKFGGSSKPATKVLAHTVNNDWCDNSDFSFGVADKGWVLVEDDYFEKTTNPNLQDTITTGAIMVPTASNQNLCQSALGSTCVMSIVVTSGAGRALQCSHPTWPRSW